MMCIVVYMYVRVRGRGSSIWGPGNLAVGEQKQNSRHSPNSSFGLKVKGLGFQVSVLAGIVKSRDIGLRMPWGPTLCRSLRQKSGTPQELR